MLKRSQIQYWLRLNHDEVVGGEYNLLVEFNYVSHVNSSFKDSEIFLDFAEENNLEQRRFISVDQ